MRCMDGGCVSDVFANCCRAKAKRGPSTSTDAAADDDDDAALDAPTHMTLLLTTPTHSKHKNHICMIPNHHKEKPLRVHTPTRGAP